MPGSFSDFLELELLDHVFSVAAYTAPGTLHLGLFTVASSDSGGIGVSGDTFQLSATQGGAAVN